MIDWITAEIPCRHMPLNSGRVICIDEYGEEQWQAVKWRDIEGSYSKKIIIRSEGSDLLGNATHLRISGNPAKFLQGHNVFGSDNLSELMGAFSTQILMLLNIELNDIDRQQIRAGEYNISRIDINYGYRLKTRADVKAWIRAAEFKAKTRSGWSYPNNMHTV